MNYIIVRLNNLRKIIIALAFLHTAVTIIAYNYFSKNGGDANLYWFNNKYSNNKIWLDFFNYGSDSILFINYPFVKFFGLPIEFGFVLYSIIGFVGICFFVLWINELHQIHTFNSLAWFFILIAVFSPNLHFWTAILGKEPFMFLFLSLIAWSTNKFQKRKWILVLSFLMVFIIRPHVFLMLGLSGILFFVLFFPKRKKIKSALFVSLIILTLIAGYFTFQLTKIKRFDWERIKRYNDFSIQSFKNSNTFVPMNDMSYPEKFFSFLFQPLFNLKSIEFFVISLENLMLLVIVLLSIWLIIKKKNYNKMPKESIFIILFTLICTIIYIERYANLGIFLRTKIQFIPFLIVGLALAISSSYINKNQIKFLIENET